MQRIRPFVQRLRATTALVSALSLLASQSAAYALPVGGQVAAGQATITGSGNSLDVAQSSERAIVNWQSFDIGAGEQVNFHQPSAQSITFNRVTGSQNASQIAGNITANGQVWLINPNGAFFGRNAQVNVAGLLATSSDIDDDRFMSGDNTFTHPGNPNATIDNAGSIAIADGGLAALVGPNVTNDGLIQAKLGKVQLASGDTFTVDLYGDGLINLQASPALTRQLVNNSGAIIADGGEVEMTAAAAQGTVNSLINMNGMVQANSIGEKNGVITIYAEGSNAVKGNATANKGQKPGDSTVLVSGLLETSGYGTGQTGGSISVLGDNVGIMSGALIDASGDVGGGTIKIGGDFHGAGITPTAINTYVNGNSLILANANTSGNGGNVVVWSDNFTNFAGNIEAKGGPSGGNGGFVETSGKINLQMSGIVNASAPHGSAGTWLMDPEDVTISTGADADESGNPSFVPSGTQATAVINTTDIVTALNAGTNVTITTSGTGAAGSQSGPNGGSITVANAISATTGTGNLTGNLTLSSYKDIITNAAITLGGGAVTGGALTLQADNGGHSAGAILVNAAIATNGGAITMGGGSGAITAGNGYAYGDANSSFSEVSDSVTINAGVVIKNASVNSGSGNIIINGRGYSAGGCGGGCDQGVYVGGSGSLATTSGNITIAGIGGSGGVGYNYGMQIDGGGTITTGSGTIAITGTGGTSGAQNYGISASVNGQVNSTGAGNIALTGVSGSGANNYALRTISGSNVIGGGFDTGTITLTANSISLANLSVQTTGLITAKENTANTTIGIGTNATGSLNWSDTALGSLNGGSYTFGDTSAGAIDINTGSSIANKTLSFISGGTIYLGESGDTSPTALTGNGSSTTTLTMQAGTDIILNKAITASGSGAMNVLLDSNYAGGGGAIVMNQTSNIASNNGYITLGGGSSGITGGSLNADGTVNVAATGFATGDAANKVGVSINSSSNLGLSSGAGNIIINGLGASGGGGAYNGIAGVQFSQSAGQTLIQSTTGNINISGTGGGCNSGCLGINETGTTVTTTSGAISLTGIGTVGAQGTAVNSTVSSTGTGAGRCPLYGG